MGLPNSKLPRKSRCQVVFRAGTRAWVKRLCNKADRSAAKRDLENAPSRRAMCGYVD